MGDGRESAQLVMMEEDGCSWCERWLQEIGGLYPNTPEGRMAPLRRVDVHGLLPRDLGFLKPSYFTPTFILVSSGKEIGRIQGYPGEDFFWAMLGDLLAKLKPAGPLEAQAGL
ncbi:MAG: hypothetical protein KJ587_03470 [Alphaproteobacteria bacterium]|nr:hypothetical protein [Alphaproteobacteria bacterium]